MDDLNGFFGPFDAQKLPYPLKLSLTDIRTLAVNQNVLNRDHTHSSKTIDR